MTIKTVNYQLLDKIKHFRNDSEVFENIKIGNYTLSNPMFMIYIYKDNGDKISIPLTFNDDEIKELLGGQIHILFQIKNLVVKLNLELKKICELLTNIYTFKLLQ